VKTREYNRDLQPAETKYLTEYFFPTNFGKISTQLRRAFKPASGRRFQPISEPLPVDFGGFPADFGLSSTQLRKPRIGSAQRVIRDPTRISSQLRNKGPISSAWALRVSRFLPAKPNVPSNFGIGLGRCGSCHIIDHYPSGCNQMRYL